jgi:hypothetical protein
MNHLVSQSPDGIMCPAEVRAYSAHQSFISFHRGAEMHDAEMPHLTRPSFHAVPYWRSTPAQALLLDALDVLDVVNAPTYQPR